MKGEIREEVAEARRDLPEDQAHTDVVENRLAHNLSLQIGRVATGDGEPPTIHVVEGEPRFGVLETSSDARFGFVVIDSRSRFRADKLILGAVATEALRYSPCSVTTVPVEHG